MRKVVGCLMANGGSVTTPAGNALTPRLLQAIGLSTLGSMGGFERLYYLFEGAFDEPGHLHPAFLKSVDSMLAFDSNVLYALLHEACYCDEGAQAPRWAAQRVRDSPEWRELFDAEAACKVSE